MRLDQLHYGFIETLRLLPAGPETRFPTSLDRCADLRLWLTDGGIYCIRQGETVFPVVGAWPDDERALERLCSSNLPSICWLVDRRVTGDVERAIVQVHRFVHHWAGVSLDLMVDDRIVETLRRTRRGVRNTAEAIRWLSDQCLLPAGQDSGEIRAFLSAGVEVADASEDSFMLQGQWSRVVVGRIVEPGDDEGKLRVEQVVSSRRGDRPRPILLAMGAIRFCDRTAAAKGRIATLEGLAHLLRLENTLIRTWQEYGRYEGEAVLAGARAVGAVRYESYDLTDYRVRFDLAAGADTARLGRLTVRDQVEVSEKPPTFIEDEAVTWDDIVGGRTEAGGGDAFAGQIVGRRLPHEITVQPLKRDLIKLLPESGFLFLSIHGDRMIHKRREEAKEAIRKAECPMPQLAALLEGLAVPRGRQIRHAGITPRVRRKVFAHHPPTRVQEEAVDVAVNTPDIALIQGPPGTGKTTVLRAIVERLNEINERSNSVAGAFLVTSFQHDAVENALAELSVNDLPATKFGGKKNQDVASATEAAIEAWRVSRIAQLERDFPAPPDAHQQVMKLTSGYLKSPGDLRQTARLLRQAADLVHGRIPPALADTLDDLRWRLESQARRADDDRAESGAAWRAVRAIRPTAEAFADDGPTTAWRARRCLEALGWADKEAARLLEKASRWIPSDGPAPFVGELASLRQRLLLGFAQARTAGPQPMVRQDVLSLLAEVRAALAEWLRRSRDGPDVVVAEYVHRLRTDLESVENAITACTAVYGATCQQSRGYDIEFAKGAGCPVYDSVLVDEAARANPLDLFIPMAQARRRIIMVGDHRQLPHLIDREIQRELEIALGAEVATVREKVESAIKESLFMRLFRRLEEGDGIRHTVTLDEQYRMHPVLGDFVSREFYEPYSEGFSSPQPAEQFCHGLPGYEATPAAWLDVPAVRGREEGGMSKSRPIEAVAVANELERLMDNSVSPGLSFGVITFYKKQEQLIREQLRQRGIVTSEGEGRQEVSAAYASPGVVERLRVGTVDAFQGKEFDVVLLSMVRSNPHPSTDLEQDLRRKYGHLMSPNRLCVSMSRQRRLLIVVGDSDMLREDTSAAAIGPLVQFYALCESQQAVREAAV